MLCDMYREYVYFTYKLIYNVVFGEDDSCVSLFVHYRTDITKTKYTRTHQVSESELDEFLRT